MRYEKNHPSPLSIIFPQVFSPSQVGPLESVLLQELLPTTVITSPDQRSTLTARAVSFGQQPNRVRVFVEVT